MKMKLNFLKFFQIKKSTSLKLFIIFLVNLKSCFSLNSKANEVANRNNF